MAIYINQDNQVRLTVSRYLTKSGEPSEIIFLTRLLDL